MLSRICSLIAILVVTVPCVAQKPVNGEVLEETLKNGLHVMLRPISSAEQTTVMVLYDIGELHDPAGRSGLAHMMEHLLVTSATDETKAMSADEWFAMYGSQANAQTGLDYTLVAASIPNDDLETELRKAAARFTSLNITDDDLNQERPRVLHELSFMYGGPPPLAARNITRQIIDPSPHGARRGGQVDDVNALTTEQMRDWYSKYYRVNNATLIIAGGFDMENAAELVGKYFSGLTPGDELPVQRERAAATFGVVKTVEVSADLAGNGPHGVVTLAYAAPEPTSDDFAAFMIIVPRIHQQLLMNGVQSSSMIQPMVYAPLDDPGAVYVTWPLEADDDPADALKTLRQCVATASTFDPDKPVDTSMFQYGYAPMLHVMRVPDQVLKMNTYGEALRLGRFHQLGLTPEKLREDIMALYPEAINRTAAMMFAPERSVAAIVTVTKQ